jgi:hypothetical protein
MKTKLLVLTAALGLSAVPACADNITVTVTGTVISSGTNTPAIDYAGLFGAPGASLNGDAFRVVYGVDTQCGGNCFSITTSPTYNDAVGGTVEQHILGQGTTSPFTSTFLTINGITETLGTAEYGVIRGFNQSS